MIPTDSKTPLDLEDEEMRHPRYWSAAFKRHKRAELVRRWLSGAYTGPEARRNLAWDCGMPYPTANRWLRQELARQPSRR